MTLQETKKLANHIFRLTKTNEIVIPIGRTNYGSLGLKFTQNSDDFEIYLDAVPLPTKDSLKDENNIELKKMIEKYLFDSANAIPFIVQDPITGYVLESVEPAQQVKPRGRPAGSKNKPK